MFAPCTMVCAACAVRRLLLLSRVTSVFCVMDGSRMSSQNVDRYAYRYGKPCSDCGAALSPENAIRNSGNLLCKPCFNARQRAWRAKTPELAKGRHDRDYTANRDKYIARASLWASENRGKRRVHNTTWRWKLRLEMIAAYGGKCACCGEAEPAFLTIDHINEDGAAKRSAGEQSGAALYRRLKELGWPTDEYQLLCMNCNFAKGHFGECPHKARDYGHLKDGWQNHKKESA